MLCDHPRLQKERVNGAATGDYVCLICGKAGRASAWVHRDRAANRRSRETGPLPARAQKD